MEMLYPFVGSFILHKRDSTVWTRRYYHLYTDVNALPYTRAQSQGSTQDNSPYSFSKGGCKIFFSSLLFVRLFLLSFLLMQNPIHAFPFLLSAFSR